MAVIVNFNHNLRRAMKKYDVISKYSGSEARDGAWKEGW